MKEVIKNTTALQGLSLMAFAQALGYEPVDTRSGVTFHSELKANKHNRGISFNGMVALHNSLHSSRVNHVGDFQHLEAGGKSYTFATLFVRQARAAKVVDTIGLHYNKKVADWQSTKGYVRFCNNSYPVVKHMLGNRM